MTKKSPDEKSKRDVAEEVVTPTRLYFVPGIVGHVDEKDLEKVGEKLRKQQKDEVTDGDS